MTQRHESGAQQLFAFFATFCIFCNCFYKNSPRPPFFQKRFLGMEKHVQLFNCSNKVYKYIIINYLHTVGLLERLNTLLEQKKAFQRSNSVPTPKNGFKCMYIS